MGEFLGEDFDGDLVLREGFGGVFGGVREISRPLLKTSGEDVEMEKSRGGEPKDESSGKEDCLPKTDLQKF